MYHREQSMHWERFCEGPIIVAFNCPPRGIDT